MPCGAVGAGGAIGGTGRRSASLAVKLAKNSVAIFCAAMSTKREPICAILPPTEALAL